MMQLAHSKLIYGNWLEFNCWLQYGMPYNFDWTVKDKPSYNDFGQQESSDGKVVTGSYFVALPDGRVQTVDYKVEGDSGFVADVNYKGEAKYPEPAKKY